MSDSDSSSGDPPSDRLLSFFGLRRKSSRSDASAEDGAGQTAPQVMRLRLAQFQQQRVMDAMVPRAEIKAVEAGIAFPELLQYFAEVTHSRLPVFRETLDDPIGFVHIKDVIGDIAKGVTPGERPLDHLRRDVLYVPPSMRLADLLVKMQASRLHLALVVDEYGGTDGLITLEDLVEVIVGDIEDEHDDDEPLFLQRGDAIWEADARTDLDEFAAKSGLDLSLPGNDAEIGTLGGVAVALAGKMPVEGDVLRHPGGTSLEILEADTRRIRRLRLHMPETSASPAREE
jgi:CBS domain containing-hemolysin-like protein